ncbi:MAG: hypothetical protein HZB91_10495 [Elusimicrobia bacterium]|nr:hypothetical protein [Elusimicrobiota bacterium]
MPDDIPDFSKEKAGPSRLAVLGLSLAVGGTGVFFCYRQFGPEKNKKPARAGSPAPSLDGLRSNLKVDRQAATAMLLAADGAPADDKAGDRFPTGEHMLQTYYGDDAAGAGRRRAPLTRDQVRDMRNGPIVAATADTSDAAMGTIRMGVTKKDVRSMAMSKLRGLRSIVNDALKQFTWTHENLWDAGTSQYDSGEPVGTAPPPVAMVDSAGPITPPPTPLSIGAPQCAATHFFDSRLGSCMPLKESPLKNTRWRDRFSRVEQLLGRDPENGLIRLELEHGRKVSCPPGENGIAHPCRVGDLRRNSIRDALILSKELHEIAREIRGIDSDGAGRISAYGQRLMNGAAALAKKLAAGGDPLNVLTSGAASIPAWEGVAVPTENDSRCFLDPVYAASPLCPQASVASSEPQAPFTGGAASGSGGKTAYATDLLITDLATGMTYIPTQEQADEWRRNGDKSIYYLPSRKPYSGPWPTGLGARPATDGRFNYAKLLEGGAKAYAKKSWPESPGQDK